MLYVKEIREIVLHCQQPPDSPIHDSVRALEGMTQENHEAVDNEDVARAEHITSRFSKSSIVYLTQT